MKRGIVEVENVSKEYTTEGVRFQALRGVDLSIGRGQFVSIVGPSGSGKSTLLHLLGCLDVPTSGEIYLDGKLVSGMNQDELAQARNETIGFVFQAFNLAPTLSVAKNVELPLIISEMDDEKRDKKVRECLSIVGLSEKYKSQPSQLSGGERQRVAIARALANDPKMILADEPTGNLDSASGKAVMDFLSSLWKKKGITVIVVTHEPVVAAYSERMIYIRDGKIEKDVLQKPTIPNGLQNIKVKEVSA